MNIKNKKFFQLQIEKQLAPRLGILGAILMLFSITSLIYGLNVHPKQTQDSFVVSTIQSQGPDLDFAKVGYDDPSTLIPEDILNFYFVSLVFGTLGILCLFTSRKKRNLFQKKE
jgi:hypothetical protein